MKPNDSKLTAYALNELPEDERQSIEKELENNPEARQTVEEIRALGKKIETHYTAKEKLLLTDEQRETIFSAARNKIIFLPRYVWMPLTSIAALAVILLHIALPTTELSPNLSIHASRQKTEGISPPLEAAPIPFVSAPKLALREAMPPSGQPAQMKKRSFRRMKNVQKKQTYSPAKLHFGVGGGLAMMADEAPRRQLNGPSIENYAEIKENEFQLVANQPLSTFSIDVDTASYANVRRFLSEGRLPPKDAVRIEEMINYFDYNYAPPSGNVPFSTHLKLAECPWNGRHQLVRIGLKGKVIEQAGRPPLNLVFLLDVSGSMNNQNKLPLVKRAMTMLTRQLDERDHVSIVVYAGASGLVLPPTSGANRQAILDALNRLEAGGGTNGGQGIELAYQTAMQNKSAEGVNRVILCTDGDFNIGITQGGDLNRLIEKKAKGGIFLSVLGFGTGNYKDSTMEQLADRGNGNYAYIDTFSEARKVLVDEMSGTLLTIAKDVKIQVEFNPERVAGYRLIGYENRMLAAKDFNDDKKDAGEIGAGHTVTALYEIVPTGQAVNGVPPIDELKYQSAKNSSIRSDELLTVKLRYKEPEGSRSRKIEFSLKSKKSAFQNAGNDLRFAASVAAFGMLLRDSEFKGDLTYDQVIEWTQGSLGKDESGYRRELLNLIRNAKALQPRDSVHISDEPDDENILYSTQTKRK